MIIYKISRLCIEKNAFKVKAMNETPEKLDVFRLILKRSKVSETVVPMNPKKDEDQDLKPYDPLKWFNRCCFPFGLSISVHEKGRLMKFYHRLHGILIITHAFYKVFSSAVKMSQNPRLFYLDTIFYSLGRLVYISIIQAFGHHIHGMIQSMYGNLRLQEFKMIERISLIGMALHLTDKIAFDIQRFIVRGFHLKDLIDHWVFSFQLNIIIHAFILYLLFLTAFYFSCSKMLDDMNIMKNPRQLVDMTCEIEIQLNEVNKIAGISYLISFPLLFIALPASATGHRSRTTTEETMVGVVIFVYCLLIILSVFTVIFMKKKLKSKRDVIVYELMTCHEGKSMTTIGWQICFDRLMDKNLFDFSVMSLFSIDFSLVMSFGSAVITFSILFFQMENSSILRFN